MMLSLGCREEDFQRDKKKQLSFKNSSGGGQVVSKMLLGGPHFKAIGPPLNQIIDLTIFSLQ